jgi:hypothetical protein
VARFDHPQTESGDMIERVNVADNWHDPIGIDHSMYTSESVFQPRQYARKIRAPPLPPQRWVPYNLDDKACHSLLFLLLILRLRKSRAQHYPPMK